MNPKFIKFNAFGHEAIAVYDYNETIKKLIYVYKGCYDYELKDIFLSRFIPYLKIKYEGYVIVPVPSYKIDDEKRGFNHVMEIAKNLNLPIENLLRKKNKIKQSSLTYKDRLKSDNNFELTNEEKLKNKKILIIDDVFTSGATIYHAISLIKKLDPKKIKVLVISKTIDLEKRNKNEIFTNLY